MVYKNKVRVRDRYRIVGFISSGTYGRVYKAVGWNGQTGDFAIKKYVVTNSGHEICESDDTDKCTGSSRTKREKSFNIPASLNLHAEKWLCAPSFPTRMSSI